MRYLFHRCRVLVFDSSNRSICTFRLKNRQYMRNLRRLGHYLVGLHATVERLRRMSLYHQTKSTLLRIVYHHIQPTYPAIQLCTKIYAVGLRTIGHSLLSLNKCLEGRQADFKLSIDTRGPRMALHLAQRINTKIFWPGDLSSDNTAVRISNGYHIQPGQTIRSGMSYDNYK